MSVRGGMVLAFLKLWMMLCCHCEIRRGLSGNTTGSEKFPTGFCVVVGFTHVYIMPVQDAIIDKSRDMGTVVMGKIESGSVRRGDSLIVMPNKVSEEGNCEELLLMLSNFPGEDAAV